MQVVRSALAAVVAGAVVLGAAAQAGATLPAQHATRSVGLVAVAPAVVLDTSTSVGTSRGPVRAGHAVDVRVTGRDGVPANGVAAVEVRLTALDPTVAGAWWGQRADAPGPDRRLGGYQLHSGRTTEVQLPVSATGRVRVTPSATTGFRAVLTGYRLGTPDPAADRAAAPFGERSTAGKGSTTATARGTVTAGGQPLAGVQVYYAAESVSFASTTTASDGTYTLKVDPAVDSPICFDGVAVPPTGYELQCTQATFRAGHTTRVDASLTAGGAVSGTITDSHGHPIQGVQVTASGSGGQNGVSTAADGTYLLGGFPTGRYDVCFDTDTASGPSSTGYAGYCPKKAVSVTVGQKTSVNAKLSIGAALTGRVVDATTGAPIVGATLSLEDGPYSFATTASNGTFALSHLNPGSNTLCVNTVDVVGGPAAGYLDTCPTATVRLRAGKTTTVPVISLAEAGGITGRLTDSSGTGIGGVNISATDPNTFASGYGYTAPDGTFTVSQLPTGSYRVCFDTQNVTAPSPTGYVAGCFGGGQSDATLFSVTAGRPPTAAGTQVLAVGAEISGTVTDTTTGSALGNTVVEVSTPDDSGFFGVAVTDDSGGYQVVGVAASKLVQVCADDVSVVTADAPYGYASTCRNGLHTTAGEISTADFALAPGGAVTGTVTDTAGDPLEYVSVAPDSASDQGDATETDQDGSYTLIGLAPNTGSSTTSICFYGDEATDGTTTGFGDSCTTVTVHGAQELTGIDAVLSPTSG